jgi:trans-aconitate 2-methyltransferase
VPVGTHSFTATCLCHADNDDLARCILSWSPIQYLAFEQERTRPVRDLLAAVPATQAELVADIGCGPGNSTEVLAARFPGARVKGFDSSLEMIAAAKTRLPQVDFEAVDIAAWNDAGPFDVILANAVLQWIPDHAALLPRLFAKVRAGGSLAVQMPDNLDEPAHRLMRSIAEDGRWSSKLTGAAQVRAERHAADWYYRTLSKNGARVDLWRTTYYHALTGGARAVVEWFKGTGLRPFLQPLNPDEQSMFLDRYEEAISEAYPALPDGTVLLPFPRLFFIATR